MKANGKFVLRTGNFPTTGTGASTGPATRKRRESTIGAIENILFKPESRKAAFDWSARFCKDDDDGCWMGFVDACKSGVDGDSDEGKWVGR